MGALSRLQGYLQAQYTLPSWTFAKWAKQFPLDLLAMVPGLTVGTTATVVAPTWSNATTYSLGQKVTYLTVTYQSLAGSNLNHVPSSSPTWWQASTPDQYPTASGETDGEIYLSNNSTPPQVFIWRTNTWYQFSSGGGGGGGGTYVLPPASVSVLGGVYTATAPLVPATPTVIAIGASGAFEANNIRITGLANPSQDTDAVNVQWWRQEAYLVADPEIGSTYATTYSSNLVSKETWVNSATSFVIKTIDYTYASGVLATEVVKVFSPADGTTVIAQTTTTYTYSGGALASTTKVRNV